MLLNIRIEDKNGNLAYQGTLEVDLAMLIEEINEAQMDALDSFFGE